MAAGNATSVLATALPRAESSKLDASLLYTYVPKQTSTWLAPITSFDPVAPITESFPRQGYAGFRIVAGRAVSSRLLH
jgi:hypothetical protein